MVKKKTINLSSLDAEQTSANTIPSSDTLKDAFKAKSVPSSSDYAALIDMADLGRKAIGASLPLAQKKVEPGAGLSIESGGRLEVREPGAGLSLDEEHGLVVNAGNGIAFDKKNKLTVQLGKGLKFSDEEAEGQKAIQVCPSSSSASFFKGMIMMYYTGSTGKPPPGWVICDGKSHGTPDLTGRFILGARSLSAPEKPDMGGNKTFDGKYSLSTENKAPNVTIDFKVEGHPLSENQIPKHNHLRGPVLGHVLEIHGKHDISWCGWDKFGGEAYSPVGRSLFSTWHYELHSLRDDTIGYTASTGKSYAHTHTAPTVKLSTATDHTHRTQICTPYHAVVFIMYVGTE